MFTPFFFMRTISHTPKRNINNHTSTINIGTKIEYFSENVLFSLTFLNQGTLGILEK